MHSQGDSMNAIFNHMASGIALIDPQMGQSAMSAADVQMPDMEASSDADFWTAYPRRYLPYKVKSGTLSIPVSGVLLHDFPIALGGYATGYEYIRQALERGMDDHDVKRIALRVNSPGGMVAGCFTLADEIYEMRGTKPIVAVLDEHAYSAAYALASACETIIAPKTGGAGSIGVVSTHLDVSERNKGLGVQITYVHAGKHKVDGNPNEPLKDSVKARMQERVNDTYDMFVSMVARNRGIDEGSVRKTEAMTFTAREAVENGLIDMIETPTKALAGMAAITKQEDSMSDKDMAAELAAATASARAEGHAEGLAAGQDAERERISAILNHEAAEKRPATAMKLAMKAGMSVELAADLLADLPEEVSGESGNSGALFENAMKNSENPNVGPDGGSEDGASSNNNNGDDLVKQILADQKAITG